MMKKILVFLAFVLFLFLAATYVFIPPTIHVTSSVVVKTTDIGTERVLIDSSTWPLWWNYGKMGTENSQTKPHAIFTSGDYTFTPTGKFYKSVDLQIQKGEDRIPSKMMVIGLALDSTGIEWKCDLPTGNTPFSRLASFREAKRVQKTMRDVLENLESFLSKTENIYGISIERNFLKDTSYVSSKTILSTYPSVKDMYALISRVKTYITQNGSQPTGSPIYNVTEMSKSQYQLMIAVPTNKILKETNEFSMKNMVKGSFMITEVVGGQQTVDKASKSLQQYFQDFRKTSMAMNFTMLVTDRMLQTDSSKWVTKLYMPVY